MRLGVLVARVDLFLLLAILLEMEHGYADLPQSLAGFRHEMFLFPLVVEQLGHLVVRLF